MQFFAIVGAQRCGTTWLYHILDEHPDISMAKPVAPEPKFFLNPTLNQEEYIRKFYPESNSVQGEKGTSYIEYHESIQNILRFFPHAKFIIILRNPVQRAISNYYFTLKSGLETRSIEEALMRTVDPPIVSNAISVNPFHYIERGFYVTYIDKILSIIERSQLLIVNYDQLVEDNSILQDVFDFLGVDAAFQSTKVNQVFNSHVPSNKRLSKSLETYLKDLYRPYNQRIDHLVDTSLWQKPL